MNPGIAVLDLIRADIATTAIHYIAEAVEAECCGVTAVKGGFNRDPDILERIEAAVSGATLLTGPYACIFPCCCARLLGFGLQCADRKDRQSKNSARMLGQISVALAESEATTWQSRSKRLSERVAAAGADVTRLRARKAAFEEQV